MEVVADGESADGMKEDSKMVGWSAAVFQFLFKFGIRILVVSGCSSLSRV